MDAHKVWLTVLGMAVVTYLCRLLPFVFLGGVTFRPGVAAWMRYVPVAILSSFVVPQLFVPAESVVGLGLNFALIAAVPTVLAGIFTRNLLFAVLVGVSSMALLRNL